jgi:hypothetical protein
MLVYSTDVINLFGPDTSRRAKREKQYLILVMFDCFADLGDEFHSFPSRKLTSKDR